MKITKEQREAIIAEANKKISDKREKEFEKYYKECTIPSEVDKLNDLASKYRDIDKQMNELSRKKTKLEREWVDIVDSNIPLRCCLSSCIYSGARIEDIRKTYAQDVFNKEFPKPNVQHLLELELLRGVFDLDAFLKKF